MALFRAMLKALAAAVLAVPALAGLGQDTTYALVWHPKEGQVLKYAISMDMAFDEDTVSFTSDLQLKVAKVEENGNYEIEQTTSNTKVKSGGEEHAVEDAAKPIVAKYNAQGVRLDDDKKEEDEDEDSSPFSTVLGNATEFFPPDKAVKIGDKWSHRVVPDEKTERKGFRTTFEVAGLDKVDEDDAVRVKFTYKESEGTEPATADGHFYLSNKDFAILRFDATVENFKPSDDAPNGTVKLRMVRKP